jgi:hypothetical protein
VTGFAVVLLVGGLFGLLLVSYLVRYVEGDRQDFCPDPVPWVDWDDELAWLLWDEGVHVDALILPVSDEELLDVAYGLPGVVVVHEVPV